LGAAGTVAEAARERELARRLSSRYAEWEKRGADSVPKGLERVKEGIDLPHAQRIESALSSTEQRDQRELARFYVDRGRRLFEQQHDSEAIAELNRALYLSPYDAEAHVLVGRIHLRNNRLREAIDALKISIWSADTAQAHLVLAEAYLQSRDPEAAKREAERAAQIDPASSEARQLLERIGGQ
jgi:tetratricopeptide (TPR) repeat protein